MLRHRKLIITCFIVAIVLVATIGVAPMVFSAILGPGVKTEGLSDSGASPATEEMDGTWEVVSGSGRNTSSLGYTFAEILPVDERVTSGSTQDIEGTVTIAGEKIQDGQVTVDVTDVSSDKQVRDENVRRKILETDTYPTAHLTLDGGEDVSRLPDDGTAATVTVSGKLTIKDATRPVTAELRALRDGDRVILSGDLPIKREDFNLEAPEFVAAKIAEEGEINIRLAFEKAGS